MTVSQLLQNRIAFKVNGREFAFKMTYEPTNACDRDLVACFQNFGICEPEVVCAMERIVRPGDVVIDGGANIGFFTIYLSQLVGDKGGVIAIEPGQNNFWKLEENVRLNKLKNVKLVRKVLLGQHQKAILHMREEGGRNSLFPGESFGSEVLDSCMLSDFPDARLVKLDIEGSEVEALTPMCFSPFVIAEMNEKALERMGCTQSDLRAKFPDTFLLQKNGDLPMLVPPATKIVSRLQNTNILLSSQHAVSKVWPEVRYD